MPIMQARSHGGATPLPTGAAETEVTSKNAVGANQQRDGIYYPLVPA
jgi:hypothetical protein